MTDLDKANELMTELRAEWLRLFEAIELARAKRHLRVSDATVTWEVLEESVELRQGAALDENKIEALKGACVRMREDLLRSGSNK